MKSDYRRISVLVHGWWGSGKSWFAATSPGPRLVLDTEGGFYDTPGEHIIWDPSTPIPTGLDKDSSVIVDVTEWAQVEVVRDYLRTGNHPFNSVIVDSIHELQNQLKRSVQNPGDAYNPNSVFDMQAWGRLLNNMGEFLRELRNLTRPGATRRINVVLVSGTDDEKVPAKPMLEGGIRKAIAGFYDVVGYMTVGQNAQKEEIRVLHTVANSLHVAKCRLHNLTVKYGGAIPNPDFRKMLAVVNAKEDTSE